MCVILEPVLISVIAGEVRCVCVRACVRVCARVCVCVCVGMCWHV